MSRLVNRHTGVLVCHWQAGHQMHTDDVRMASLTREDEGVLMQLMNRNVTLANRMYEARIDEGISNRYGTTR